MCQKLCTARVAIQHWDGHVATDPRAPDKVTNPLSPLNFLKARWVQAGGLVGLAIVAAALILSEALREAGKGLAVSVYRGLTQAVPDSVFIAFVGPASFTAGQKADGTVDWQPVLDAVRAYDTARRTAGQPPSWHALFVDDSSQAAANPAIASKLCADRRILAVVGYVWTSAARRAIPSLANCVSPVPTFVVGATGDVLDSAAIRRPVPDVPMLRLPFSNTFQARQIVLGLAESYSASDSANVLILYGAENRDYSHPFADQIKTLLQKYNGPRFNIFGPELYSGASWNRLVQAPPPDRPAVVVFVGNYSEGKDILRGRPPATRPLLVVTDGMVNRDFRSTPEAVCAWGAYPSFPQHSLRSIVDPTFSRFAIAALDIIDTWIAQSNGRLGRPDLARFVVRLKQSAAPVSLRSENNTRVAFGRDGDRIEVVEKMEWPDSYHLLQVTNTVGDSINTWYHRPRRHSLLDCRPRRPSESMF